jgi:hypothetical protein
LFVHPLLGPDQRTGVAAAHRHRGVELLAVELVQALRLMSG